MTNINTNPELWDEATVIEDKDGKRYSWSLPHGFRGSQHLTTWGRKLLCGQQGSMGGSYEKPFGSERACQVCTRMALALIEKRLSSPAVAELIAAFDRVPGNEYNDWLRYASRHFARSASDDRREQAAAVLHYFAHTDYQPTTEPRAIVATTLRSAS